MRDEKEELKNHLIHLKKMKNSEALIENLKNKISLGVVYSSLNEEEIRLAFLESGGSFEFRGTIFYRIPPRLLSVKERNEFRDQIDGLTALAKSKAVAEFKNLKVIGEAADGTLCLSLDGIRPSFKVKSEAELTESQAINEAVSFVDNNGAIKTMKTENYVKDQHKYNTKTQIRNYKKSEEIEYNLLDDLFEDDNG